MANIKRVKITGTLPFNCGEHLKMRLVLGDLNGPTFGLRMYWGLSKMMPNTLMSTYDPATGSATGQTAVYNFTISGEEAVSSSYLVNLQQAVIDSGGMVFEAECRDIENNEPVNIAVVRTTPRKHCYTALVPVKLDNPTVNAPDLWLTEHMGTVVATGINKMPEKPKSGLGSVSISVSGIVIEKT